jgi:DNA-binding response OmpR family regulator
MGNEQDKKTYAGTKVIYIEDDRFLGGIIVDKLTNEGFIVRRSITAEETFNMIDEEKPAVVLADVMLPGGMDGFQILEKMKTDERYNDIPVILLTNLDMEEDRAKGLKLGAARYITKSVMVPNQIIKEIKDVINESRDEMLAN